jgi:hypothetical protein
VKEERVTEILKEELFVEEDEGGLSLNSIAFAEKEEVRNRSNRNRKGLPKGLRGEGSGAIAQPLEEEDGRVRLKKEEEGRVSEPVRGLLLEFPGGNGP